jgi:hypothetical protein
MELVLVLAGCALGVIALVQSFRAYDANQILESYRKANNDAERRLSNLYDELRMLEKKHARMVQAVVDVAERIDE